jgi:DNA repair protein REV1
VTASLKVRHFSAESKVRSHAFVLILGFIGYYKNSRLHHLSAWKAELRSLLQQAQEKADRAVSGDDVDQSERSNIDYASQSSLDIPAETDLGVIDGSGDAMKEAATGLVDGVSMRGAALPVRYIMKSKDQVKSLESEDRVIMHCDFDCFFVSAGLVSRPHLKGKPVVVCHSQGAQGGNASTSEIASASYEAREFGVRGGMRLIRVPHDRVRC